VKVKRRSPASSKLSATENIRQRIGKVPGWESRNAAEVARRYGIAERVLRRWKQELATLPTFVTVKITDGSAARDGERAA